MPDQELMLEYLRILRRAWLNPSYHPWSTDVCLFEREHSDVFERYWSEWQKKQGVEDEGSDWTRQP